MVQSSVVIRMKKLQAKKKIISQENASQENASQENWRAKKLSLQQNNENRSALFKSNNIALYVQSTRLKSHK